MQDEGRKTAASTYLIDSGMQDYGKSSLEMQVHHQGTLSRRNHVPSIVNMDSPPQRTTASGTLSGASSTTATHLDNRCQNLSSLSLSVSSRVGQIRYLFFH